MRAIFPSLWIIFKIYFERDSDDRVWDILTFASLEEECWNVLPRRRFHPSPRSRPTLEILESSPVSLLFLRSLYRSSSAGNIHAQAWPHSRWKLVGETHSGKAPRSTPPTIGLLSRYFLPTRRTTPASSRRWSWDPYMAPRPGGKSSLPHRRRPGKSFPTSRADCFLFLLFLSVSRDRRPFFRVPPIPASSFCAPLLFPSYREQ